MKPKISVILPVYNAEKYLRDTLDSVLGGSFSDFEIVAVNDGSCDSSLAILESYRERDGRVKVIDKQNTGVSDTRNVAIAAAEGDYLAFLDADDIYSPEYLERMYSAATDSGADVTVCSYVTFRGDAPVFPTTESTEAKPTTIRELLDTGLMTPLWVKLVKKSIVVDNGIVFETEQKYSEDLFYSWKVCLASGSVCMIGNQLYGYRLTSAGATCKFHDNLYRKYKDAYENIRAFLKEKDKSSEEENLNISFTRGIPAFLLMISRKKCSLKHKIFEVKEILSDDIISEVLNKDFKTVAINKKDMKLYAKARKRRPIWLLMHGYYMDARIKLANMIKR